jgi:hypothetical protein
VTIRKAIAELQRLPETDKTRLTIERLQRALVELDAICADPEGGCGPNMVIHWK